jgi:hypothetical protein
LFLVGATNGFGIRNAMLCPTEAFSEQLIVSGHLTFTSFPRIMTETTWPLGIPCGKSTNKYGRSTSLVARLAGTLEELDSAVWSGSGFCLGIRTLTHWYGFELAGH